jgi:hypothetical protein
MRVLWKEIDNICNSLGIRCTEYDYYYEAFDNSLGWLLAYIRNRYREILGSGWIVRRQANTSIEFDCDDYASIFKAVAQNYGLSVGFALGYIEGMKSGRREYHAFNILPFYEKNLMFLLVEPQNVLPDIPWLYTMRSSCVENVRFSSYTELFRYCVVISEF